MKKYTLEQFPKNKDIDASKMSNEQLSTRVKVTVKMYTYSESFVCKKCGKEQSINEYYIKSKETGRRSTQCRDCAIKSMGCRRQKVLK